MKKKDTEGQGKGQAKNMKRIDIFDPLSKRTNKMKKKMKRENYYNMTKLSRKR